MSTTSASNTDVGNMDCETIDILLKKYLFQVATKSEWENVVQAYRQNKRAHKARITRSGDTALHIAVLERQQETVEELVNLVSIEELKIQNDRGNTPLHIAAAQGNVRMCDCIANKDPSLVGIHNKDKETPLFLAALHGKKEAFLCLHYICNPDVKSPPNYSNCRRDDGETILHCAIAGDCFDLAFHIITLYKDLVDSVNQDGFSALHLLASKPSAFMSGSHLGPWTRIIYHCILVDELEVEEADLFRERIDKRINKEKAAKYQENYKTCINFLLVFWNLVQVFVAPKKESTDPENPEETTGGCIRRSYNICFDFVKLILKALAALMLFVLGFGSAKIIKKIRNKKETHKWAVQVVDKLLEITASYASEDSGTTPQILYKGDETIPYPNFGILESMTDHPSTNRPQQNDNKGNNSFSFVDVGQAGPMLPKATENNEQNETPILIAAKNGVSEMVDKILEVIPVAIHDINAEKKNVVLLAVENKQRHVYRLLLKSKFMKESVFSKVDKDGNTALHLAAKLGEDELWLKSGAALQMQWEIKWFEEVERSIPVSSHKSQNADNLTARGLFHKSHKRLMEEAENSTKGIASSCTVIGALIVTIMFTAAFTIPGGNNGTTGFPVFIDENLFLVFIASDTISLVSSTTSVIIFLGILTSRYSEDDFLKDLPRKMMIGLFTLFIAIATMMMAFSCGLNIMLHEKYSWIAIPSISVASIPTISFMWMLFPLLVQTLILLYTKTEWK